MGKRMFVPNHLFKALIGHTEAERKPVSGFWPSLEHLGEYLAGDVKGHRDPSLVLLKRAINQAVNARHSIPVTVPLVGQVVPGCEGFALFFFDPARLKLHLQAISNLPPEFVGSLACDGGNILRIAAGQSRRHLVMYLPEDERFASLREQARQEGVKTLWLIPWHQTEPDIYGVFLFAFKRLFSPDRDSLSGVTLLADWISGVLRQIKDRQTGQPDPDKIMRELAGTEKPPGTGQASEGGYFQGSLDGLKLQTFEDKDGIPVMYDADICDRQMGRPDEISVLSHELLSPLTLIKGYTTTLLQLSHAINEEQKTRYLKGIESAANKLIHTLENLRDLVHLEEMDSSTYHPSSLYDVMQKVVTEVQGQTATHFIKIRRFASLPKVNINRQRIEQVISNLLYNAIKYSPSGSDVEVEIDRVINPGEMVRLCGRAVRTRFPCLVMTVSDLGKGIPEAELERIFDRYHRVDNEETRRATGHGLGLYICRVIVKAHGGRIWAVNRPQGGSTFCFSLPLEPAHR